MVSGKSEKDIAVGHDTLNRAMWMMERGYEAKSAYLVYLYARRMGYFEMAEDARQSVHELIFRIRDGMKPTKEQPSVQCIIHATCCLLYILNILFSESYIWNTE